MIFSGTGILQNKKCGAPVGLIDMYPTLLEYCNFPASTQNQGHSLIPLRKNPNAKWQHVAHTSYGRGNHAVQDRHFRYIRYEDGSEELYDHRGDPNEWTNLAGNPEFTDIKKKLNAKFPKTNAP